MSAPAPNDFDGPGDDLSDDLRGRVKAELDPGERLLWVGRPVREPPRSVIGFAVFGLIAAGLLLVSVSSFVIYENDPRFVSRPGGDPPGLVLTGVVTFGLAAAILLLVTLAATSRRNDRAKRAGTLYALTDLRAIIWVPEPGRGAVNVYTILKGQVSGVHRTEYPDGTGDVHFRVNGPQPPEGVPWGPQGFEGVADVRRVEEQFRRALVAGAGAGPGSERV